MDDLSIQHVSTSTTKPDLWQCVFDEIKPKEQELIQSISIPKSHEDIDSSDVNTDPGVMDCLKALNGVVKTVKTQYNKIDQGIKD